MSSTNPLISSITIYVGLPIFISGTLGNIVDVRLLWRTRRNPCAFIFIVSSLVNCIVLFYGLFTRILSVGFHLDWSTTNHIWCKTRVALTQSSFLISLTCICLASIDRFLVSCRQEKYRKLSRLSIAIFAVIITNIFWISIFVPYLIYADILRNPTTGLFSCTLIRNDVFAIYQNYIGLPILYGLLPSTTLIITGIMTYRNTKKLQINRQRELVQKQLTSMMLIQIPIILLSTLPYVIFTEYTILTATVSKSVDRRAAELLITNIFTILCYITFACPFFVFFSTSSSFRQEAKILLLCRKTNQLRINQIQPYSTTIQRYTRTILMRTN
ncbi:unnamed protein product [Rotaria sp. Silwood2]|nr:unnamed protein product [Rotaria sp. Silwood2]CAF3343471.1 unnamed protein product [Rotaria sp. Silwood2]CAF4615982.1 unnamed protein product [Rotaria sp. Silwood2]